MFDFVKKLSYYPEKLQAALSDDIGYSLSTVFWDLLSNTCNYNCIFCDGKFRNNVPKSFPKAVLFRIADELQTMGVDSVLLCGDGGEPLLHPNFVDLSSRLNTIGCKLGVYTNGSYFNTFILNELAKFDFIRVSLNAGTNETYQRVHGIKDNQQFNSTLDFVKRISELNENVGISFLLLDENIHEMYMAASLCQNLGVRFIEFKPAYLKDYTVGRFMYSKKDVIFAELKHCQSLASSSYSIVLNNQLAEYMVSSSMSSMTTLDSPRRCKVSKFRLVISPSGYYLCTPYRGVDKYRLGDPFHDTLEQVWFSSRHKNLIDMPCSLRCTYHEQNECLLHDDSPSILQNTKDSERDTQISFL